MKDYSKKFVNTTLMYCEILQGGLLNTSSSRIGRNIDGICSSDHIIGKMGG